MLKRLALVLLLTTPAHAGPLVIENDLGGLPDSYVAQTVSKVPMEIRGNCYSACTIYLGNPNACFDRDAVLYFHASSWDYLKGNVPTRKPTADEMYSTEYWVTTHYPAKVKRWIKKHGGLKVTVTEMLELKGKELHSMARICKTDVPQIAPAGAKGNLLVNRAPKSSRTIKWDFSRIY